MTVRINAASYQRVLGDELRKLRKKRGWTRKDLNQRLHTGISLQTLATYELGTRQCSVVRLLEICTALDVPPHEVLATVHERVFGQRATGRVRLDLALVAEDTQPELLPLRRWAADRLSHENADAPGEVHLDLNALEQMAALCGMDTVELLTKLRTLTRPLRPS